MTRPAAPAAAPAAFLGAGTPADGYDWLTVHGWAARLDVTADPAVRVQLWDRSGLFAGVLFVRDSDGTLEAGHTSARYTTSDLTGYADALLAPLRADGTVRRLWASAAATERLRYTLALARLRRTGGDDETLQYRAERLRQVRLRHAVETLPDPALRRAARVWAPTWAGTGDELHQALTEIGHLTRPTP